MAKKSKTVTLHTCEQAHLRFDRRKRSEREVCEACMEENQSFGAVQLEYFKEDLLNRPAFPQRRAKNLSELDGDRD